MLFRSNPWYPFVDRHDEKRHFDEHLSDSRCSDDLILINNVLKLEEDRYDCYKISSSSISDRAFSLLIDLHPVDHHLHRQIFVVDLADPVSPQRLIQDQVETLVKRPLNLISSIQFRVSKTSPSVD